MTKKIKTEGIKMPIIERRAVYPLRCGLEVYAIVWDSHEFIKGKIISTYSMTELNEPGAINFYNIETENGELYEVINEDDVFLTAKEMREFIMLSFDACDKEW